MTEDQQKCIDLLAKVFGGKHHLNKILACGTGIRMKCYQSLSTYDNNLLTTLVLEAHKQAIRVEIQPSNAMSFNLLLHYRGKREGSIFERHPTIEQAIALN